MTPDKLEGLLEGLQIAAFICQELSGDRNSNYSHKIMNKYQEVRLRAELDNAAKVFEDGK